MEYQLIEAVFEAKHSLHRVIHFAKVPRGTFAALFLIDQMNREPQQERAMPGVTVSMLSDRLHNSRPAVTRLINDLEEQGYVVKLTAKQDRRFVYLMLTQEGQAVLCQAKHAFSPRFMKLCRCLGRRIPASFCGFCGGSHSCSRRAGIRNPHLKKWVRWNKLDRNASKKEPLQNAFHFATAFLIKF